MCIDYMEMDECNMKDSFPLSCVDDLLHVLRSAKCMTHLNLPCAYDHIACVIFVYKMIVPLRQAFQCLTTNGYFFT